MLIPLGIVCGIIYYSLFRFIIIRYNLMTPGRETDEVILQVAKDEYKDVLKTDDYDDIAIIYVEALGG